jgi:hypothetical protein
MCRENGVATFFHTPFWAGIFERTFPGRFSAAPQIFRFSDGTSALLPLVVRRRLSGLYRVALSMPAGTFGGFLSTSPLTPENEAAMILHLCGRTDLIWRENPYSPVLGDLPESVKWYEDPTQVLDLEQGYERLWKRATAGHRNAVRNALRSGVEITEAATADEWKSYVDIYLGSINRWKERSLFSGVSYSERFFLAISGLEPHLRRLWLAKLKGKPVAGILCFYWNRHAVVWHGAGHADYFSFHPNNLLYDRAIAHAAENGFRWFDTNPSGDLAGVRSFKKHLGAQPLRSRVIIKQSKKGRFLQLLRNRVRGN